MINSDKLKGRIKEKGKTQKDCADVLGIKPATFSQKINGIRAITLNEAEKLQRLLGITNEEFPIYFFSSTVA